MMLHTKLPMFFEVIPVSNPTHCIKININGRRLPMTTDEGSACFVTGAMDSFSSGL